MSGFRVMAMPCSTCIYRKDTYFDLARLENACKDKHGFYVRHRECHHTAADGGRACCRGFWNAHKDEFAGGQIAQRLNAVSEVKPTEKLNR